ncbi:hypothetical protein DFH08DRAFT_797936 [Mycena albidolilacea]|uniref:Uncharacterized protein n=1 Tax=Mycena albidolilacea TaxID=1033008 RepID=A0AAD7F3N1_9AGAR|nr:hypothetical protein DFH08DRAFT_797936 [Mycena albidolilacea]
MIFTTLISLLAAAAVAASPLKPQQLVVITPHITSPDEKAYWTTGSTQTVTWNTAEIPPAFAHYNGTIMLGAITNYTNSKGEKVVSENLDWQKPLASGFPMGAGRHNIVVPDKDNGDNYIIVLLGDSGNCSPQFKIRKAASSQSLIGIL